MTAAVPLILLLVAALIVAAYIYFPRVPGLHYTSKLTCPRCGYVFEYPWVPGGSLDAVRWGIYRLMRCPSCGRASWFDVWNTRVSDPA